MNIAIFGGSFDPVHIGHEMIINKLSHLSYINKLIVVPTYLNPFKKKYLIDPEDRFKILDHMYRKNKNILISDFEINRNESTPSIITVEHFKSLYNPKKIYLVIGSDNLRTLHLWDNFEKLNKLVEFIVVNRDGYEVKNDIIQFKTINMNINISSSSLRDKLDIKYIPKKIQKKVTDIWNKELKKL
ncbi:nicotinate (nicotinamide) nucleotide adenylyltransferase [Arcobacter sp. 15-2]|uniref:nicotinate (nicotinamide) nucleotide adenylyltransferase n=1 Tax=Arcobacter sp. 15-2 TaxID=3374109 RepID=UPI00399C5DE3